jgi:hypothetical protein
MELEAAGRRADDVATVLRESAARIDAAHPPATGFGADASGALGELGRAWAARVSDALMARTDEVRALADEAAGLAARVMTATAGYRDIESRRGGA